MPLPRIVSLEEHLANQIAAGEVIERPASVAKELIENSLDAGARRIRIDVDRGGVGLVRVVDDGHGIHKEDLRLALSRHATSKIRSLRDLEQVQSMGFRGEALPSIASVSRFELASRLKGADAAWIVSVHGEAKITGPRPCAQPEGTAVSVADLFFNTPARRRFLRTEKTEYRRLLDVVRRLALARHDVAIQLKHNDRRVLNLSIGTTPSCADRVIAVCGVDLVKDGVFIEEARAGLRLYGWAIRPQESRSHTDDQYFFVNGRVVKDSVARHALRQAYQDLIPHGRHPAYVLYLEVDSGEVDVNVHPTKHEVRFREARLVHDFLFRIVRHAVTDGAPTVAYGSPHRFAGTSAVAESQASLPRFAPAKASPGTAPLGRALTVVGTRYLLSQGRDDVFLVAVALAWEAVVRKKFAAAGRGELQVMRPLLIPNRFKLAAPSPELQLAYLAKLGFDIRMVGPDDAVLRQVPACLAWVAIDRIVAVLCASLAERQSDEALFAAVAGLARDVDLTTVEDAALNGFLRDVEQCFDGAGARPWVTIGDVDLDGLFNRLQGPARR